MLSKNQFDYIRHIIYNSDEFAWKSGIFRQWRKDGKRFLPRKSLWFARDIWRYENVFWL